MNSAHLHLAITHVPILSTVFGLALLLIGSLQRNRTLQRTSLWTFIIGALTTIPTYLSGRPASALLMKMMPGLSADPTDQHAEVAVLALAAATLLGLLAGGALALSRGQKPLQLRMTTTVAVVAVVSAALMAWTAQLGGNIRHTEIRSTGATTEAR